MVHFPVLINGDAMDRNCVLPVYEHSSSVAISYLNHNPARSIKRIRKNSQERTVTSHHIDSLRYVVYFSVQSRADRMQAFYSSISDKERDLKAL